MTIIGASNSKWHVIGNTNPSGVTSVTHTGCEDYDWIVPSFSEVETSASGLIYIEVGYGATPTYYTQHYVRNTTVQSQFNVTQLYPEGGATTGDRRAAWVIQNFGRYLDDSGETVQSPVFGFGFGTSSIRNGSMLGVGSLPHLPITTIRYSASAGNLQGTGAIIRTLGLR